MRSACVRVPLTRASGFSARSTLALAPEKEPCWSAARVPSEHRFPGAQSKSHVCILLPLNALGGNSGSGAKARGGFICGLLTLLDQNMGAVLAEWETFAATQLPPAAEMSSVEL